MSRHLGQVAGHVLPLFILLWAAGCGGGNSDGVSAGGDNAPNAAGADYTIGGKVSGLSGTVTMQNNGANDLSLSVNSAFAFTTATVTGSNYSVTVLTHPAEQICVVANGAGTVSGANVTDVTVTCSSSLPPASLALFAGDMGSSGNVDGVGAAARFDGPSDMATDSARNIYVADFWNSAIRKITPAGVVTTLTGTGGRGSTDGIGTAASFFLPGGVATDSADNVYVADTHNNTIRKITPAGVVTTLAGTPGVNGNADGTGAAASFVFPLGMATDSAGNIYVAENENGDIRKITPAGVVTTFAANLALPNGVETDSADNVYVADSANHVVRKITPAGVVTTLAGTKGVSGSADGNGDAARFNFPCSVAVDSAGNVYVADSGNHTIRKITPDGVVSTVVGVAGQAGFAPGALPGLLNSPAGVAVSGTSLYITVLNGVAVVKNRP